MSKMNLPELKSELAAMEAKLNKLYADIAAVEKGQQETAEELEAAKAGLVQAEEAYSVATCFEPGSPKEASTRSALAAARERLSIATDRVRAFEQQVGQFFGRRHDNDASNISKEIYKLKELAWKAVQEKELEVLPKTTVEVLQRAFGAYPCYNFEEFLQSVLLPSRPTEESWKASKADLTRKYGL